MCVALEGGLVQKKQIREIEEVAAKVVLKKEVRAYDKLYVRPKLYEIQSH